MKRLSNIFTDGGYALPSLVMPNTTVKHSFDPPPPRVLKQSLFVPVIPIAFFKGT